MSDASFISDMATSAPSFYANCTQNREQQVQQPEPETGICEMYLPRNAAICPTEIKEYTGPSEIEIKEYMDDPHVAEARQRLGSMAPCGRSSPALSSITL